MPIAAPLTDLVLPRRCCGCATPGSALCESCAEPAPAIVRAGALDVVAAAVYAGAIRTAIVAYKERGRRDLGPALAALLRVALFGWVERLPGRRMLAIPVPSTRRAAAARGGDHVVRLATRAAARTGCAVAGGTLGITRAVADSAGLGVEARAANLAGAFTAVRPAPPGCVAVIVDDVVTTGATLAEAHRALTAAGWPVLGAAVVAATPLRRREPTVRAGGRPAGPIGPLALHSARV